MSGTRAARIAFSIMGLLALASTSLLHGDDILTVANRLVQQRLAYIYGSANPNNGGLDCSGFVQVVFRESCGIELPDEADKQLDYCHQHGQVWDSTSGWTPATLQPGDLIFFAGPDSSPRASMVTHVMIYCGEETMVGAQGRGREEFGYYSGVGAYHFLPHYPGGVLGESGERFVGLHRVFAYGRLNVRQATASREAMASLQRSAAAKSFACNSSID